MKRFRQFALPRVEIRGYITKHAQPRLRPQVKKRRKKCSGRLCTALPQSRPTSPTRSLTWRKHRACWKKNGPVPGMRTGSTGGPPPYWNIFIPSNLVGRKHNLRLSFRNAFAVCNVAFAREIYPVSFRELSRTYVFADFYFFAFAITRFAFASHHVAGFQAAINCLCNK